MYNLNIFHNTLINRIVIVTLLIIGILGTSVEIGKIKRTDIKGLADFGIGAVLTTISIFFIIKLDKLIVNIICFIALLLGIFGLAQGVFKIGYSIKLWKRKTENKKLEILRFLTVATEVIALIAAVIQLIAEIV